MSAQLRDHATLRGFTFQRAAPGADDPLVGHRVSDGWVNVIRIKGFSRDCSAWRQRTSALIVFQDALVQRRLQGSAVRVLHEVLTWAPSP